MATEIYSIEDLDDIRLDLSGDYELMVDLDFEDDNSYDDPGNKNDFITGTGWIPLGEAGASFSGGFNGNFNDITNLYTTFNNNNVGLFGNANTDNEIKNVRVIDFYISVADFYSNAGGLCGVVFGNGSVYNCFTSGTIEGRATGVGGLVGFSDIVIDNCYSHANVTGNSNVGGLIGDVRGGSKYVSNCYSTGTVSRRSDGTSTRIGGFAGRNWQSRVRNCYSTGEVIYLEETNPTNKGFCGNVNTSGDFEDTDNFWDMNTSNQTSSAGNATGKTTAEMKNIDTYTDVVTVGLDEAWDMAGMLNFDSEIWTIVNGITYPMLTFERKKVTGVGTELSPYELQDWYHLADIRSDLDANYKLTNNLDSSTDGYTGIGDDWTPIPEFTGELDGGGYIINNLKIDISSNNVGLFTELNNPFIIRNLQILNAEVSADNGVGILAGYTSDGLIENVGISGSVSGAATLGGLAGSTSNTEVKNSFCKEILITSSGGSRAGGFIGNITGTTNTIDNCYSVGEVDGSGFVGGFAGELTSNIVFNSYSACIVSGSSFVGGFSGGSSTRTASNCFWDTDIGPATSYSGTGKTTIQMKDIDTYTDTATVGLDDAWDMILKENHDGYVQTAVWFIDDGLDYPGLFFELDSQPISSMFGVYVEVGDENTYVYGNIPYSVINKIYLELDFNGIVYNTEEHNELFEYWNGSAWVEYPSTGLTEYFNNQFRFITTKTTSGYVRRIRGYTK